jgi:hypothetical protein
MLDDRQEEALRRWYARPEVIDKARELSRQERWEDLEEHVQMTSLMPLSRTEQLPDYLLDENGKPLLPNDASPMRDVEEWRDAIEVGWKVMEGELGVSQEHVHRSIAQRQSDDWDAFLKGVERRKQERKKQ